MTTGPPCCSTTAARAWRGIKVEKAEVLDMMTRERDRDSRLKRSSGWVVLNRQFDGSSTDS